MTLAYCSATLSARATELSCIVDMCLFWSLFVLRAETFEKKKIQYHQSRKLYDDDFLVYECRRPQSTVTGASITYVMIPHLLCQLIKNVRISRIPS